MVAHHLELTVLRSPTGAVAIRTVFRSMTWLWGLVQGEIIDYMITDTILHKACEASPL